MSSSPDTVRRTRLVRRGLAPHVPVLPDLDAPAGATSPLADPEALAEQLARGYEEGRANGYADGFEVGRADGLAEAEAQRRGSAEAAAAACAALAAATAAVSSQRDATVAALEDALASAAFRLAEAVVGRELELATSPGRDAIARALRLAEGSEPAVVRMHPDDVETLDDLVGLAGGRDVSIVADPSIERAGCLVQLGDGLVDARISAALERVREVLWP